MSERISGRESQDGVVLIEVLIAVLVFAIGVLAVIGLQAAAIANVADSRYRLTAGAVASGLVGQMWTDQANLASYNDKTIAVPELPNGTMTTKVAGSAVTIRVEWQPPNAATAHAFDTVASIYGG